ncbi:MAG: hypothetical protein IPM17_04110 [Verrucomicrobia bacterium]|jgi:hypothetical protein|nr:hypothetical protein [Verrucomicrobiota bacterium]
MVANYATGQRRFDSYGTEAAALEAANPLARQLSAQDVLAASLTNEQAADYAAAIQALTPFNVALPAAATTLAECLKLVQDLPSLRAAATCYAARRLAELLPPARTAVGFRGWGGLSWHQPSGRSITRGA